MNFIPILEEDGSIRKVGKWLLEAALKQASAWQKIYPDFVISINISYVQMLQSGFREMVMKTVKNQNTPPKLLILELTESCKVSDPNRLCEDFQYFKDAGINMALDDFGTEYSSIALLRKLKPQWIKIDHTFVRSINDDEMDSNSGIYYESQQTDEYQGLRGRCGDVRNFVCGAELPSGIAPGLLFFKAMSCRRVFQKVFRRKQ